MKITSAAIVSVLLALTGCGDQKSVSMSSQQANAGGLEEKVSHLIGCCKWSEAADLLESGVNPFGASREESPFEADVSACFNSIRRLSDAYIYRPTEYEDAYRILKATVIHPGFTKYLSGHKSHHLVDDFAATMLRSKRVDQNQLFVEMGEKGFHFSYIPTLMFTDSIGEEKLLQYLKEYVASGEHDPIYPITNPSYLSESFYLNYSSVVNYLMSLGSKFDEDMAKRWFRSFFYRNTQSELIAQLDFLLENGASANFLPDLYPMTPTPNSVDYEVCDIGNADEMNTRLLVSQLLIKKYHSPINFKFSNGEYIGHRLIDSSPYTDDMRASNQSGGVCKNLNIIKSIIQTIVDGGYDVNWQNGLGNGLLHKAIMFRWPLEMIDHLKKMGANPNLKNNEGKVPSEYCSVRTNYCNKIKQLLL